MGCKEIIYEWLRLIFSTVQSTSVFIFSVVISDSSYMTHKSILTLVEKLKARLGMFSKYGGKCQSPLKFADNFLP